MPLRPTPKNTAAPSTALIVVVPTVVALPSPPLTVMVTEAVLLVTVTPFASLKVMMGEAVNAEPLLLLNCDAWVRVICEAGKKSYAPMLGVEGRAAPRWSKPLIGVALLIVALPALIAALPFNNAIVKVGPPLICRGPRSGSPEMFPDPVGVLEAFVKDPSSTKLLRLVLMVPLPA